MNIGGEKLVLVSTNTRLLMNTKIKALKCAKNLSGEDLFSCSKEFSQIKFLKQIHQETH